jgi:hypothetical protein
VVDGEEDANHQLRKLWEIDSFGVRVKATTSYTRSEQRAVDIMNETCRRVESGYELGLLWKTDRPPLPNNFKSALSRLESVERRLQKDSKLADGYCKAINAYVEKGFARKLSPEEFAMDGEQWLLPYHPVINSHKVKPLPRVVSSPEVLVTIPETERSISNENLQQGELPTGRALGVRWDARSDTL